MIHSKVKQSLDKILPTETEKERMKRRIMKPMPKKSYNWIRIISFGTLCMTSAFCIFLMNPTQNNIKNQPRIMPYQVNQVDYKGKCYTYVGSHNGEDLILTKDQIAGGTVYQMKDRKDQIIIYVDNEYQLYQICKGE